MLGSSSNNDSDGESSSTRQWIARNGETWTPLLCARTMRSNPSNIVVRSGVNPSVCYKTGSSLYDCWKLLLTTLFCYP